MKTKTEELAAMTLEERIQWGTSKGVDLDCGYLGASPEFPGGCQTVGRVNLMGARLISEELLTFLTDRIKFLENELATRVDALELELANAHERLDELGGDQ